MTILWDDVRYLESIHAEGSVGGASRALGISPSTVYRRIAALELAVGTPCLVRAPGPVALTAAGATLADAGRATRRTMARAAGEIRAREGALDGEVSLTTVNALFPFLIDPITTLQRDHGLVVTLHLGDSGPSVREREVDVAIGVMRRPPPGCWGRRLGRLPYAVFGTREAIARRPVPGWVTRSFAETYAPEAAWERLHAGPVVARAPFAELVALVAAGVGVGLMPRAIAAPHRALCEVPVEASTAKLERTVWLLTHPDLRKTARVALLMRAIAGRFERVL
jgi:DNA-binding transcriptional LysR family regulator